MLNVGWGKGWGGGGGVGHRSGWYGSRRLNGEGGGMNGGCVEGAGCNLV